MNNEVKDIRVEELKLSTRAVNCLRRMGVDTLGKLMQVSNEDLSYFSSMGSKTLQEVIDFKEYNSKTDYREVLSDCSNEKTLVIHEAHVELCGESSFFVLYKNKKGEYSVDVDIADLEFTARTKKWLLEAGYSTIDEVANLKYDTLISVRNLGPKCVREIIDYLREKTDVRMGVEETERFLNGYEWFKSKYYYVESSEFRYITIAIKNNISEYVNKHSEMDNSTFVGEVLRRENVILGMVNHLRKEIIKERTLNISSLRGELPSVFFDSGCVNKALLKLVEEKVVEKVDNEYRIRLLTVDEWVETLGERDKKIVEVRLNGGTLEQCGEVLGVTRERSRQILKKVFDGRPDIREDDYAYWYKKYLFEEEAFEKIFGKSSRVYNYMECVYKKGSTDIEDMLNDEKLTGDIYRSLFKFLNRGKVIIEGEYVDIRRDVLCRKIAEIYYSEHETTFGEYFNLYMDFLRSNNLEEREKLLFPSERAFEANVSDSLYILLKYGKRIRYYPINEYDIENLVSQLHLEKYKDIEISTRKLFFDNEELMEGFGIQDEYELHNLLKKTAYKWNRDNLFDINFGRMPLLIFGTADRVKQAVDLLYQVAPVTIEEYSELYEMEYGMLARTVMANVTPYLNEYYHNGMYQIDQPLLEEDEYSYMHENLDKSYYYISDVKDIYVDKFGNEHLERINPRTLKMLGFNVYVNYIISNKYQSSYAYFRESLLSMDNFDYRTLDSGKHTYNQASNNALEDLRREYELLEYEDMKFIKFERLHLVHDEITKESLMEYAREALSFNEDKYFTIYSLKNQGFDSNLHGIGLSEWFNACLVRNYDGVRFIKTGGNIVFRKGDRQISTIDFFRYVLSQKKSMNIYDFIDFLKNEYNVKYEKDKVVFWIKDTDLYYDGIMDKIYYSKEYYYEEI